MTGPFEAVCQWCDAEVGGARLGPAFGIVVEEKVPFGRVGRCASSKEDRAEGRLLKEGFGGGKNEREEAGTEVTVSVRREREVVEEEGVRKGSGSGSGAEGGMRRA